MSNKDKFKLVKQEKKDYLLEDDTNDDTEEKVEETLTEEEKIKKAKKVKQRRIIITILVLLVLTIILFGGALLWQMRFDLMGFANALSLTFLMLFFIAWIMFVYNKNILSPLIHGFKVFGLMIVGKRSKESYYDYSVRISENPIPKYIYLSTFICSFIVFIPATITVILSSI